MKKMAFFLMLLLTPFFVIGCGGKKPADTGGTEATTEEGGEEGGTEEGGTEEGGTEEGGTEEGGTEDGSDAPKEN